MKRDIIKIDEAKCNGCGVCVPNCHEGALQIIDGKVRLISDLMCDGLGACIGHCPEGAITIEQRECEPYDEINGSLQSQLRQWPVQLHLINPEALYFIGSDLLVAADCSAFTLGDFHQNWLRGKSLVIACPKLDQGKEIYLQKLITLIESSKVNTITVLIMEVPCCGGLLNIVEMAVQRAERTVPVKAVTISIKGEILNEQWI